MVILFRMPRVTEAHRQARRDEIAHAALRVLQRRGVSDTSIAQIVDECGLSAGAIYGNFENKAELARYIVSRLLAWRVETFEAAARDGVMRTPREVLAILLGRLRDHPPPLSALLQFWGEATVDPDLHALIDEQIGSLVASCERSLVPWASEQDPHDARLAARTAQALIMMCQGFLANAGLFGWMSADEYLETAGRALGGNADATG